MVAAWIKAETGVGPSVASGSQVCKPICADLPTAANRNNKPTKLTKTKSVDNKLTLVKEIGKFKSPIKNRDKPNAAIKLISPTRLTIIAFKAALLACKRVYQKLIKRYEHKPTPSQPKNKINKLVPETNNNIKVVKRPK